MSGATATAALALQRRAGAAVSAENALAGTAPTVWESDRDESIVGFTTQYSVLPGATVSFKVTTASANWRIRIFRLGWYGGAGARWLADVSPSVPLPQVQPAPRTEPATGLVDCGNWAVSATWTVPANAVSGVYYALLEKLDGDRRTNHIPFVVRSTQPSDILVQTSETTQHAYNRFGGNSLYYGQPVGRAFKVSYNRPFDAGDGAENDLLNAEIALIRFLERNGYDVTYCAGIDVHQDPSTIVGRKVFISSGHDEYVSGPQRSNVTAARDRGTHLIFMTGNEYFWKVRFETSIDGSATPNRTMVCYKETLDNAKIDPSSDWTGTWRDPRFSPPSNGGLPENELTGQLFRAILPVAGDDLAITVPGTYAHHRIWRHTPIATLSVNGVRTLGPNTLGYEFDVDADNGFRPPGLIRLSETTATVPQLLLDHGSSYAEGTCVHSMTMYRAASGALVWGLGTVQWAYGLDSYHIADTGTPTDPVMAQATVNVLADMGVQPTTLQSGLVPASRSTDTLPPVVTIVTPSGPTVSPVGSAVTVSGTAVDAGGGVVAAVEVSVDAGQHWHPAAGTVGWSYVTTPTAIGSLTVLVRAVDDSCNIGQPAAVTITVGPREYPCTIWPDGFVPAVSATTDSTPIEAGVRFQMSEDGFVRGIRFYKGSGNTGSHVGSLWSATGSLLGRGTFTNESPAGWQTVLIDPVPIAAGTTYVASVFLPQGHYAADAGYFATAFELPPLRALASGDDGGNGLYRYGSTGFPTSTFGATNYWVDVLVSDDDELAPTVLSTLPAPGLEAVSRSTTVSATFSEPMTAASVAITLVDAAGAELPGSTVYDPATRTATLSPSAELSPRTTYTATVTAAHDRVGNAMAAPYSWQFTTASAAGASPATLWDTSATPAALTAETSSVELGVRFTPLAGGSITALRFYKAPDSEGPHVGRLWGADGTLLATATYSTTTASGWQQTPLDPPVDVSAGTTYVASYHAPHGRYAASGGGLRSATERPLLRAPASTSTAPNGVYRYGSSAFPTSSWNASNYWVDVVLTLPPDTTPPAVTNLDPGPGLIAVSRDATLRVSFSEPIEPSTLSVTAHAGATAVAGSISYDDGSRTATFTPSSRLASATTYSAAVGAADTSGNALAPVEWSFTTETPAGTTPATLWTSTDQPAIAATSDTSAIEVGMRFTPASSGHVSGLRFYKGTGNEGPHIGHVWQTDGTLLASVTFGTETASGWQQAMLSTPVPVTAGTTYVVSYFAPAGRYSATPAGFSTPTTRRPLTAPASSSSNPNGQFSYGAGSFPSNTYNATNYWVDVIFVDSTGPSVASRTPAPGATAVATGEPISLTFSEPADPASVSCQLRDSAGAVVAVTVDVDATGTALTLTPVSPLAPLTTYTASVTAAVDLAGNALAAPDSWSFTTAGPTAISLWPGSTVPATIDSGDSAKVELGVKLRSSAAGQITAIRFYKGGLANAGPHTVSLWTASGSLLSTATSSAETARGWQTVALPAPVPISPDTVYVASYLAPAGHYSVNGGYFNAGPAVNGPLNALANGASGPNGVFAYGGGFPASSYNAGNYWVDVHFVADS